jgi:hypothetical protein
MNYLRTAVFTVVIALTSSMKLDARWRDDDNDGGSHGIVGNLLLGAANTAGAAVDTAVGVPSDIVHGEPLLHGRRYYDDGYYDQDND